VPLAEPAENRDFTITARQTTKPRQVCLPPSRRGSSWRDGRVTVGKGGGISGAGAFAVAPRFS
jgi:hypothetical protein